MSYSFVSAQTAEGQVRLKTLNVTAVRSSSGDDGWGGGDPDWVWKFKINGSDWVGSCIQITSGDYEWHDSDGNLPKNLRAGLSSDEIVNQMDNAIYTIELESWEDDGCEGNCTYNRSCLNEDQEHCSGEVREIALKDYRPGIPNEASFIYCNAGNPYGVRFSFSYTVPVPQTPQIKVNGIPPPDNAFTICDPYPLIELSTNSYLKSDFLNSTYFIWQYEVADNGIWRDLGQTDADSWAAGNFFSSDIRYLLGVYDLRALNTDVRFRVLSKYVAPDGSFYETVSHESNAIHLSPVGPDISNITTSPACFGVSTGRIDGHVSGLFSFYKYVLRPLGNTTPCNPDIPGNCGGDKSGTIEIEYYGTSGSFSIEDVPNGSYTLLVTNPGSNSGVCYNTRDVTINELPSLQLIISGVDAASCHGSSDGAIRLSATGGKLPYGNYALSKAGGGFLSTNSTGEFTGLSSDTYVASITDACNQVDPSTIATVVVSEPVRVNAAVTVTSPTCNSPANGDVQVDITQGEGDYVFKILQRTEPVVEENASGVNWSAGHLSGGTYTVEIRDAQRLQCDGFTEEIVLSAPEDFELIPSQAILADVDCYGRSNGSITLADVDLSGQFKYTLTGSAGTGSRVLFTTPIYSDLPADRYTLEMARNVYGCTERAVYAPELRVEQPQQSVIMLDKQDISCYGETDGRIAASVTGATASDQYIWEVLLGGGWASMNKSSNALENLSSGTYRMRLTNNFSCTATSPETTVIEPALLSVSSVGVKDVACFGSKGEVTAVLDGGTLPYTYSYTSATQVVNSPSSLTLLDADVYALQARDARGCAAGYTGPIMLTTPERPLTMSVVLSDYNGFNISCAGATDGYAALIGAGGNGGSFSGYTYALDNGAFQSDLYLRNIGAGDHTFFLRDARGCTIHTDLVMSAPASQLQALLLDKNDIRCAGDSNGSITLQAQGGVAPYIYTLDGVSQPQGIFSSLGSGSYTIVIIDRNHCNMEYETSIAVQVTPMDVQLAHTDVWCHGGNNGTVQAQITGGASPFRYQWSGLSGEAAALHTLRAGSYHLTVTDQEGCRQRHEFAIGEPEALSVHATAIPVCVGKANGEIRLKAEGGTPVYAYSINDGLTYQRDPQFSVGAGIYTVRIRDQHQCEMRVVVDVTTRRDLPDPNFIVAMTQQASDTLLVREISVPKPDSVWWTFDPAISVVNDDHESPLITVSDPGSYDITMRGFFGGCDYIKKLTLTISPFDPEVRVANRVPARVIKTLTATPNSNDGHFDMTVEMEAKQRLTVTIYDMLGVSHYRQNWDETSGIDTAVDISGTAAAGVYVIQAVTDTDVREIRLVVNK